MFISGSIRHLILTSWNRCNDYVEFLHNVQRIPFNFASGVELNSYERLGWSVHVFHLRVATRVCVRELRGAQAASTQRGLPTGGKPGYTGEFVNYPLPC